MRTIATLNLPSSTSGIWRSAPPPCGAGPGALGRRRRRTPRRRAGAQPPSSDTGPDEHDGGHEDRQPGRGVARITDVLLRRRRAIAPDGTARRGRRIDRRVGRQDQRSRDPGRDARCARRCGSGRPTAFLYHRSRCSNGPRCPRGRASSAPGFPGRARSPSPRTSWPARASRRRARPASPTSWSTSPSRAPRPTRRPAPSARRSRASAARSTPRPTANRPSTGSACRAARPRARWTSSAS